VAEAGLKEEQRRRRAAQVKERPSPTKDRAESLSTTRLGLGCGLDRKLCLRNVVYSLVGGMTEMIRMMVATVS
jgi:hypothetical protein